MGKICYLLMSKVDMELSSKQVLERVKMISGDKSGCYVINAARGFANHYDFSVICENFAIKWPQWLKYHFIVCVPESNMSAVLLKVGCGVVFHLTVPEKKFVTQEMTYIVHQYREAKSSLPVESRDDNSKIWKEQIDVLLEQFKNG